MYSTPVCMRERVYVERREKSTPVRPQYYGAWGMAAYHTRAVTIVIVIEQHSSHHTFNHKRRPPSYHTRAIVTIVVEQQPRRPCVEHHAKRRLAGAGPGEKGIDEGLCGCC